jgi:hypothetical protein
MLYWNFTESAIDNPAVHQSRIQQGLKKLSKLLDRKEFLK